MSLKIRMSLDLFLTAWKKPKVKRIKSYRQLVVIYPMY